MKSKTCISHTLTTNNPKPFKPSKDNLHNSNSKPQHVAFPPKVPRDKPCVSVPVVSLEKIPNLVKSEANIKMNSTTTTITTTTTSTVSSSTSPASATLVKPCLVSTTSKSISPSPEKILNGKGILSSPSLAKKYQNGTRSSNKSYKRLSEREFDPNKHCGVLEPETKKPCTRSLTCKTHSLNHRRAVPGRRKQFDILLAEHKARSREKEVAKDKDVQLPRENHQCQASPIAEHGAAGSLVNCSLELKVTSPAKSRSNAVLSKQPPAGTAHCIGPTNNPFIAETPLPSVGELSSRLSSDEEMDAVEEVEKLDCHYSGHHPKPLGFCTFGRRLMGRGYYVFDRRWDRFRLAFHSMVEKHLNSQMWKKIPPAADSPMPLPAAPISSTFSTSGLQTFSSNHAVYLPSAHISSRHPPSNAVTPSAALTTSDTNSLMSYTSAFIHGTGAFNIMDSTFKSPSLIPPVPHVIASSHKSPKTKNSKPSKLKDMSARSDESSSSKKKKQLSSSSLPLQTSSSCSPSSSMSSFSGSHKRNCILSTRASLNSYQTTSSFNSMSSHSTNNGPNPHNAKTEPSERTSLSGSSADSIKHMSLVVSSIDPTLPVPSLIHHSGDHSLVALNAVTSLPPSYDKSVGKKRKTACSNNANKTSKVTKMPGMNSVHKKSTASLMSSLPDSTNNPVARQMGKSCTLPLSQSSPSALSNAAHNKQKATVRNDRTKPLP
ncbi:ataxin-7-like protein 1 isoform X2 [Protopterus annectens]|nr:ataxin-7-like protein 1 isoform X2 [Protopterus annectens]